MKDIRILKLDIDGCPAEWINHQDAANAIINEKVAWELGEPTRLFGGISNAGVQSFMDFPPIMAVRGDPHSAKLAVPLPVKNRYLFPRDNWTCQYCATEYSYATRRNLSCDHIIPLSRGGKNKWMNVVAACKRCNHFKADRTPEECGLQLINVPFEPNIAEKFALKQRFFLDDQIKYLASRFSAKTMIDRYQYLNV